MTNILVTGGAGFIGSNYVRDKVKDKNNLVVNLDALTYAGNLQNLEGLPDNHIFKKGNICDEGLLNALFDEYEFDQVVNFAAESHVDRSIMDPYIFLKTNVLGTQTLLNVCRARWCDDPKNPNCKDYRKGVRYLQVSTDEVYGTLGKEGKFSEVTPIAPNSPYSASKASADLFVRAYHRTFGFPCLITRCSNNYGPNQFPEKLIPLTILNALSGKKIPVYGNGLQIRDWIYVSDHCSAVDVVLARGEIGEVYNIGCENEWKNIDIVKLILSELGKGESSIEHVTDRPGHDVRYAMDNTKIKNELGWIPKVKFEEGIKLTIRWYLDNQDWIDNIITGKYRDYSPSYVQSQGKCEVNP